MRLFISYARTDKPFCTTIAEMLDIHEVWYDERLWAGQDWWRQILRMLNWCDAFIYLLSRTSVTSAYCDREYKLALKAGRIIIPVLIDADTPLPNDLRDIHYVDFSMGVNIQNQRALLNAITRAEREMEHRRRKVIPSAPVGSIQPLRPPALVAEAEEDPGRGLAHAAQAMQAGRYDDATMILKHLQQKGLQSKYININRLLQMAERGLEEQTRTRKLENDYRNIVELIRVPVTRQQGIEAFVSFHADNPDHDPYNLAERLAARGLIRSSSAGRASEAPVNRFKLPMLEWCDIPAGQLRIQRMNGKLSTIGQDVLNVAAFKISKYPVTNAQYQMFVDDPYGYTQERWWQFSRSAHEWWTMNPKPAPSKFKDDTRPRENVTWFEAMAFCNWLSWRLNARITLPTRQQWQRAARGDDERAYPWGDDFDTSYANTSDSRLNQTTGIMHYPKGASPFGVMDMAGNVWEWCINSGYEQPDITTNVKRAVQGGSYLSDCTRAQTNFHLVFSPENHFGSIGFRIVMLPSQS